MSSTTDLAILDDNCPLTPYIPNYGDYFRSNGKLQKNVVNTISFLNQCDCTGAVLVIVVSDWKDCDSLLVKKLFSELDEVHVWTRDKTLSCHEGVRVRYNRPGLLSYKEETRRLLLVCSIREDGPLSRESEAQNLVLKNVNPEVAMMRFRPLCLRRRDKTFSYYEGVVMGICFIQACSLDAHLIVKKGATLAAYNVSEHKEKMFHYNTVVRTKVIDGMSFDESYCMSILTTFCVKRGAKEDPFELWSDILSLTSRN